MPTAPQEYIFDSEHEAQAKLQYWQRALRLTDWTVALKIARAWDLSANTQGRCQWTLSRKEASIKILDSRDYEPGLCFPQDQEVTLVHELLHLHFAQVDTFEAGTPLDNALESAIHAISLALVREHRREVHKDIELPKTPIDPGAPCRIEPRGVVAEGLDVNSAYTAEQLGGLEHSDWAKKMAEKIKVKQDEYRRQKEATPSETQLDPGLPFEPRVPNTARKPTEEEARILYDVALKSRDMLLVAPQTHADVCNDRVSGKMPNPLYGFPGEQKYRQS